MNSKTNVNYSDQSQKRTRTNNKMNQPGLDANTCNSSSANGGKTRTSMGNSRLVLVLLLICREGGVSFFNQSQGAGV